MAGTDQAEIIVAAAALVVSLVAFAATLMQCLQQYYASARGYSECNENVIGKWAQTKSRRFSWEELRFEVQFDAPVIFVCPPSNKNAPVPDAEMFKLDGTDKSLDQTWTTLKMTQREDYKERSPKARIHTSDNERASWTILLSAIQVMERDSRTWHEDKFKYDPSEPPKIDGILRQHSLPNGPPTLEEAHTLVVALQRKRKSWDTMPTSITRPYATTTMCHLVEMLAALGVYWKEFNRRNDRYRAEGNGFMVLGERISDLGLMFSFQVNGLSRFQRNRVIPVDEIKELCFGWVPTIYRSTHDKRRLEVPIELLDLSTLQMASRKEIAETLVMLGCNNTSVKYFSEEGGRTSHLFPISFEILGMLSQTFHIENTYFTFIPNPTPDHWDRRSVSLVKMMEAFQLLFVADVPEAFRNRTIVDRLNHHIKEVLSHQEGDSNVDTLLRFRALHAALDDADDILTSRSKASRSPPEEAKSPIVETNAKKSDFSVSEIKRRFTKPTLGLHIDTSSKAGASAPSNKKPAKKPQPGLHKETPQQRQRREKVQDVLRSHIQEVLRLLNDRDDRYGDQTLPVPSHNWKTRTRSRSVSPVPSRNLDTPTIEEVDAASPDERQHTLMEVYFKQVRRLVVHNATQSADRRASLTHPLSRRGSVGTPTSPRSPAYESAQAAISGPRSAPVAQDGSIGLADMSPESPKSGGRKHEQPQRGNEAKERSLADEPASHDDIWCTLVFRTICWLMLHDFNKLDVQVPKSELLGSRMPVYVA